MDCCYRAVCGIYFLCTSLMSYARAQQNDSKTSTKATYTGARRYLWAAFLNAGL